MADMMADLLNGVASDVQGGSPAKKPRLGKKGGKDKMQELVILLAQSQLGIYQRLRAIESVCFEFFELPSTNIINLAAKACGTRIAEKRKAMRASNQVWKLDYPIHVAVWSAAIAEWSRQMPEDNPHKLKINNYLAKAAAGANVRKDIGMEMSYFRRLDCYDKSKCKFIINCQAEGTETHQIWEIMVLFFCSEAGAGKRLQGVAPRNAKERQIAKLVDTMNGKKVSDLTNAMGAAMDDDDF